VPLVEDLKPTGVAVDKAYDSGGILAHLQALCALATIPNSNGRRVRRPLDKHAYRSGDLVERFIARLKQFRCISTRCDQLAKRFASFIDF
jgi:transposase